MRFFLISTCFLVLHAVLFSQDFNVLEYGAVPDGKTMNTTFIQKAIDAANSNGSGRVIIPTGTFLSGSIILKSGVELHLKRGAVLLGSTNPDDYIKLRRWKAFVIAEGQTNIAVTGHGEINGQGRPLALNIDSLFYAGKIDSVDYNFTEGRPKYYLRPQLIEFENCRNIQVRNVTLRNAACWVQTHDFCQNIVIDSVTIYSDAYWNNDGIDIQDCTNVRITNCNVNAADDGICIKSNYAHRVNDSIYISDCTIRSSASAIKLGTRSHGQFTNIVIRNIKVYDTFRSAIAIENVDGGFFDNILVENIEAKNTGNAIFIRLGKRHADKTGKLQNVVLRNIKVEVPFERPDYEYDMRGPNLPFFHNIIPASITGIPGFPVKNVTLENIEIVYPGRGNPAMANMPLYRLDDVPERINTYPEFSMFGELPAWGFYVRHVDGLTFKNVSIRIKNPDYRPALVFDDAKNLILHKVNVSGDTKQHQIILHNSKHYKLDHDDNVLIN